MPYTFCYYLVMQNETALLNEIKRGDIKAFENIFRQYYLPLYIYALSITHKQEIAEEVVQDLFYTWWRDREKMQITHSLKSYLYTAVKNKSLQHIKHNNVREQYRKMVLHIKHNTQSTTPQQELEQQELETILNNALSKLPERQLMIFTLHRFEAKKYKEIAEMLSLSVKTIEAEMSKVYQTLRKEVGKYQNNL